jgi:bacillithiol system protein YtxJ
LALSRLERTWKEGSTTPYFLDLISYREISKKIAEEFQVEHQSPQVLIIKGGQSVYDASHMAISFDEISKHI